MQMFEVGGCVRDEILGIPSKDIDFSVVLTDFEVGACGGGVPGDAFATMRKRLTSLGFEIFVETPEFLTIRARFPKGDAKHKGLTADFVLARKESEYSDGRRPDRVQPGRLIDDLRRRDFKMNAIAKDSNGALIDPFGGLLDIEDRIISCVGDPRDRIIKEDALRGLRAIRFSITKDFEICNSVLTVLQSDEFRLALRSISTERIQGELDKAFKVDTAATLKLLAQLRLVDTIFGRDRLRLMTTTKS